MSPLYNSSPGYYKQDFVRARRLRSRRFSEPKAGSWFESLGGLEDILTASDSDAEHEQDAATDCVPEKTTFLSRFLTIEKAARAGIFYNRNIPYNFPDSPEVLPPLHTEWRAVSDSRPHRVLTKFTEGAGSSGRIHEQSSGAAFSPGSPTGSSGVWCRPIKKMKSIGGETFGSVYQSPARVYFFRFLPLHVKLYLTK